MNKNFVFAIGAAAVVFFLLRRSGTTTPGAAQPTVDQMRNQLISWVNSNTTDTDYTKRLALEAFNEMTAAEITASWYWVFKQQQIQPELSNLSVKYNLFT